MESTANWIIRCGGNPNDIKELIARWETKTTPSGMGYILIDESKNEEQWKEST